MARIVSSRVDYAVSPFLSFSNLIQFDNRSGNLGLQSRVRWTVAPWKRPLLHIRTGLGTRPRGRVRLPETRHEVSHEISIYLPLLILSPSSTVVAYCS